jgi:hypothetical protein
MIRSLPLAVLTHKSPTEVGSLNTVNPDGCILVAHHHRCSSAAPHLNC